ERILPVGLETARLAVVLRVASERSGRGGDALDALIGATAQLQGLTVVTRNLKDFAPFGVALHNPWSA
ncbi:MAG: VapC toxin family PIN domain ribonuclease, partial [Beijerinckiaceae bacterium]